MLFIHYAAGAVLAFLAVISLGAFFIPRWQFRLQRLPAICLLRAIVYATLSWLFFGGTYTPRLMVLVLCMIVAEWVIELVVRTKAKPPTMP